MNVFGNWNYPTNIKFGPGRISELAEGCKLTGMKKPLLVTDRGLADLPITQGALDVLEAAGLGRGVFSEVDPNPTEVNLAAGLETFKQGGHDGVILFGGGSALDLGKMIAFMSGQSGTIWDYEDIATMMGADPTGIASIIAVPTTAGTGSEVGQAAVITNSVSHEKKIMMHPQIMPSLVICDPELTVGMPKAITAGTGLDAFAHCVEAFSSLAYHPMSQGIALEGMRLVVDYLPRAYADGTDIEARAQMMSAAAMGATAFQKGLGAIHALSHPIGAMYHTHHGTTNAICMPAVIKFNRPVIEERFDRAASYLGIDGGYEGFCAFVDQFNAQMGIPKRISDLGVSDFDVEKLVEGTLKDPTSRGNPVKMTRENTLKLYEEIL